LTGRLCSLPFFDGSTQRQGWRGFSAALTQLSFGSFNRQFPHPQTDFDWLSRDATEVQKYIDCADGHDMTVGFWTDFLRGLLALKQESGESRAAAAAAAGGGAGGGGAGGGGRGGFRYPVLVMAGERDPCHERLAGITQICSEYDSAGHPPPKVQCTVAYCEL
jgi:alpha-beta hydrolase superfamily lysophospholipase